MAPRRTSRASRPPEEDDEIMREVKFVTGDEVVSGFFTKKNIDNLITRRKFHFSHTGRWLLSVLLFAVALGLNLYRLGAPSVWFDEAFSVELARQPLPLLWYIIFGPEPNMELYYLFLHFWLALTGWLGLLPTEFVVRFPSAIFAALSTVVVFLLGRRFAGNTTGALAAGLYLLNDLQLVYAQQARSYSLQLLLTCIAWYALLAALTCTEHPRHWWSCYVLAMVLAVYAHLFSLLILLAQVVAVAGILVFANPWRRQARQQLIAGVISLLAIGVLTIPMLIVSRQGAKTSWNPVPHLSELLHLFLTISGDSKLYLLILVAICALGVLIVGLGYLTRREPAVAVAGIGGPIRELLRASQEFAPLAFALLCWFILPITVSFIVSQGSLRLFSSRYLVVILPSLFLLVGLSVQVLRWRIFQVALAIVLIVLALLAVPLYYRSAQVEDWNSTAHWVEQHYQTGDGLVCYDNSLEQGCQVSIEYYLHAYPSATHFTPDSPGSFSWQKFGPADAAGPDAAVDPTVLATFAARHPRVFYIVGRARDDAAEQRALAAERWLDQHYQRVGQIVTRTVTVYLYDTGSTH
jgi:uncharacterized membrane protein